MKTFIDLANEADIELSAERTEIAKQKKALEEKKNIVAKKLQDAEEALAKAQLFAKEIEARNEEVSRKENTLKKQDDMAAWELALAEREKVLAKMVKKVEDDNAEVDFKLKEVEKREMELSDNKKKYKEQVEKEVMQSFLRSRSA